MARTGANITMHSTVVVTLWSLLYLLCQ